MKALVLDLFLIILQVRMEINFTGLFPCIPLVQVVFPPLIKTHHILDIQKLCNEFFLLRKRGRVMVIFRENRPLAALYPPPI